MEVGNAVGEVVGVEAAALAVVGVAAGTAMTLDARTRMARTLSVSFILEVY